jgi:ankyrin repeat protein
MNLRQRNGRIPLHVASQSGHIDIARLLLDCGCDVNTRDAYRWTPLHYASQRDTLALHGS